MQANVASTMRLFLLRLAFAATILFLCTLASRAGGPARVAGSAYFDSSVEGRPLTWSQGRITYYVDQGNLSPVLPNSDANALVASAFSQWTSVPTAALSVTAGGSLAEDVSGANVSRNADGTISMPPDRWQRVKDKLDEGGVEYAHIDGSSLYFRDPDGARIELISDPLGEMYGKPVF